MAEPRDPREPRIPKETAPFDADNKWTRTWIMYFESLFDLSVKEAVRQAKELGVQGPPGVSTSVFHYRADTTSTAATDPGAGKIRWNNATQSSATFLYFDWLTADDFDVTTLWSLMNAPDQFIIQDKDLAINHQIWQMTGPVVMMPDWFQVPVTFISSSGAGVFSNNQAISVLIPALSGGGGGGSGTVTSVALTVPVEFSVSGSPVTTSGTLAVTKATQSANTVYAGPTSGGAAAPAFRAVDPADLPVASSSAFGAVKVDGTTITASSGVISTAGGGLTKISETVLGSATATVTFSSIPGSYRNLMLTIVARSAAAANFTDIYAQFNGDTGANYSREGVIAQSTGNAQNVQTSSSANAPIGGVAAANSLANAPGIVTIIIPNYAGTVFAKAANSQFGAMNGATVGTWLAMTESFYWNNTAAISSILIGVVGGSNFVTGSVFTLYGY
jgi:hypothetical protein